MNNLALSPLAQNNSTVMETIMKPLSYARRGARWLMAAGIAVAMFTPLASHAEDAAPITPELKLDLDNSRVVNPRPDVFERSLNLPLPTFQYRSRGCLYRASNLV